MRDERTPGPDSEPVSQDVLEHAVLHLVLARHPAQVHVDELVRAVGEKDFLVSDAVTDLVADGLLYRHGDFVVPTRAALRLDELGS